MLVELIVMALGLTAILILITGATLLSFLYGIPLFFMVFMPHRVHLGSVRIVVLLGDHAFKWPRLNNWQCFMKGREKNRNESQLLNLESRYLAPACLIVPGNLLLMMVRAEPIERFEGANIIDRWNNELQLLRPGEAAMLRSWVVEKPSSFGWIEGQLVAVDYGEVTIRGRY